MDKPTQTPKTDDPQAAPDKQGNQNINEDYDNHNNWLGCGFLNLSLADIMMSYGSLILLRILASGCWWPREAQNPDKS